MRVTTPNEHIVLGDLLICDGGSIMLRIKRKGLSECVLIEDIINQASKARSSCSISIETPVKRIRFGDIRLINGVAVLQFKQHHKTETMTIGEFVRILMQSYDSAGCPLRDSRISPTSENRLSC